MRRIAIGFAAALVASGCQLIVDNSDLVLPERTDASDSQGDAQAVGADANVTVDASATQDAGRADASSADAAAPTQDAALEPADAAVSTPDAAAAVPDGGPLCTPGLSCTPDTPCHTGTVSCSSGTKTCTDTAENEPNGTACGTNLVCSAGECVTCVANETCTPTNPCHVGKTACATGTAVCTDTSTNVGNGTGCGTNLYCNAGQCQACTAGLTCEPANPCHGGTTACTTGVQVCVDSGIPFGNGTGCGQDKVCNGGVCVTCLANLSCYLANPCKTGTTSCDTGTSKCLETGSLGVGESCGTNKVCNASATCVSCTAGQTCTSSNSCHSAQTSCDTGAQVCTDTGNLQDGTGCGTDKVCSSGNCVSCIAGQTCTSSNPCHSAQTSCNTGVQVCSDTGNLLDGTGCGVDKVCSGGDCLPCVAGATCALANPCRTGTTSCATGSQVCTDLGPQPDGMTCGTRRTCCAGSCVDENNEWANWPVPPEAPTGYSISTDTVTDYVTGLVWQRTVPSTPYSWVDAKTYCASLSVGGQAGWRLPTAVELLSILDSSKTTGAKINTTAFPSTPSGSFWSSTPYAAGSSYAWYVSFGQGLAAHAAITASANVRCVR